MAASDMQRILVTGALGQIGSELVPALRERYGADNVVASDLREPGLGAQPLGPFVQVDVCEPTSLDHAVSTHRIDSIVHLAAILSATGEKNPQLCWRVNMDGLKNVLDLAERRSLTRVFVPSSIAVFGPETPKDGTPQDTVLRPRTMYGLTKVAGELLAEYYTRQLGVDCRGVRYPGIISHVTEPGGGTTDYAVAIFHAAVERGTYECFVSRDTVLPMMYMPDAIKATIELLEAPREGLTRPCSYNVAAMSFSADELAESIARYVPGFQCTYVPDYRQAIADSWPRSIDDSVARADWGWQPAFDLDGMTRDMLAAIRARSTAPQPA